MHGSPAVVRPHLPFLSGVLSFPCLNTIRAPFERCHHKGTKPSIQLTKATLHGTSSQTTSRSILPAHPLISSHPQSSVSVRWRRFLLRSRPQLSVKARGGQRGRGETSGPREVQGGKGSQEGLNGRPTPPFRGSQLQEGLTGRRWRCLPSSPSNLWPF